MVSQTRPATTIEGSNAPMIPTGPRFLNSPKKLECWYWKNEGGCQKSESECKFAHEETGITAKGPHSEHSFNNNESSDQTLSKPYLSKEAKKAARKSHKASKRSPSESVALEDEFQLQQPREDEWDILDDVVAPKSIEGSLKDALELPIIESPFDFWILDPNTFDDIEEVHRHEHLTREKLCWVLQNAPEFKHIDRYVRSYEPADVRRVLSASWKGVYPVCYAVGRTCHKTLGLLTSFGADVNVALPTDFEVRIPLIAFAIMKSWQMLRVPKGTEVVRKLLALGADHEVVPRDMWEIYIRKPLPQADTVSLPTTQKDKWCTGKFREGLAEALDLTHRYLLVAADEYQSPKKLQMQCADLNGARGLFELPFYMIAQRYAIETIQRVILSHLISPVKRKGPLVLMFGGPSGHGKTELARKMGDLLSVNLHAVDCTDLKRETDLFGPHKPYQGWQAGAPLNKFFSDENGQRAVVLLDEFEKTEKEIHQTLLTPFDEGLYRDRTSEKNDDVDCKNMIFVLTTNLFDDEIIKFYEQYLVGKSARERRKVDYTALSKRMRDKMRQTFGAPLAGRINDIIPFFPFTDDEAAVIGHKNMLSITDDLYEPPDIEKHRHCGNIHIEPMDEGSLCQNIEYLMQEGARSIERDVQDQVLSPVLMKYLNRDDSLDDVAKGQLLKMVVELQPVEGYKDSIVVREDGTIAAPREFQVDQE